MMRRARRQSMSRRNPVRYTHHQVRYTFKTKSPSSTRRDAPLHTHTSRVQALLSVQALVSLPLEDGKVGICTISITLPKDIHG